MLGFLQNTMHPSVAVTRLAGLWRFFSKQVFPDTFDHSAADELFQPFCSFAARVDQRLDHVDPR